MKSVFAAIMLLFIAVPAQAACNSPTGQDSQTRYDFTAHKMYYCNNTNWVEMGGGGFSNPAIGTLDMGTNRILNVGSPTANSDAATKEYVDIAAAAAGSEPGGAFCYCTSSATACDDGFRACTDCLSAGVPIRIDGVGDRQCQAAQAGSFVVFGQVASGTAKACCR